VQFLDLASGQVKQPEETKSLPTSAKQPGFFLVDFSPDGRLVAAAGIGENLLGTSEYEAVAVWEHPSGRLVWARGIWDQREIAPPQHGIGGLFDTLGELNPSLSIKDLYFSKDGHVLVSEQGRVAGIKETSKTRYWDPSTGADSEATAEKPDKRLRDAAAPYAGACEGSTRATTSTLSPDGGTAAIACDDYSIKLWAVDKAVVFRTLTGHNDTISHVAFSPDGRLLASVEREGSNVGRSSVRVWKVNP
jgi:WD40 repeat protein